jgi:hypothetical protein
MVLRCEDDNFVKLREIRDEIVDPGTFCCAPTMLTLREIVSRTTGREELNIATPLTSQVLVTNKSSIDSNKVYGFW